MVTAAIYLVVFLTVYTAGPFGIFKRIRRLAGIQPVYDIEGDEIDEESNGTFLADVLSCHRCATPYFAVPIIALWFFVPYAVYALGVMGIAVWMAETSKTG